MVLSSPNFHIDRINAILVADLLYKLRSIGYSPDESYLDATSIVHRNTQLSYRAHAITETLGTPTIDADSLAAAKATFPPIPEGRTLVHDPSECGDSIETQTIRSKLSDRVAHTGEDVMIPEPLHELGNTDGICWGETLQRITTSQTLSRYSQFTNDFMPV